jgi:hypothetical protein
MAPFRTVISSAFLSLALLALSPANQSAQAFGGSSYKAEAAILSAGSRAAAISRLRAVPSVGVVNLNIRTVPRFRSNETDVAEYKVSAGKNFSGIKRLRNLHRPRGRRGYFLQRLPQALHSLKAGSSPCPVKVLHLGIDLSIKPF